MNEKLEAIKGGTVADIVALATTAGVAMSEPIFITADSIPFVVTPEGFEIHHLEHLLPAPKKIAAAVKLMDVDSFVLYVLKHRSDSTSIYGVRGSQPRFVAVIDDHAKDAPAWQRHKAEYACPLSDEWKTWTGKENDGKPKPQSDFARFIENNLIDIIEPESAEILTVSRTLEAKKKVEFASAVRLDNGDVQFTYNEDTAGTAGKGQINVPERFTLAIPVFEGGPLYKITARLRYRIAEGGVLNMWYELERPHKVIEHAAKEVWEQIEVGTATTILNGLH